MSNKPPYDLLNYDIMNALQARNALEFQLKMLENAVQYQPGNHDVMKTVEFEPTICMVRGKVVSDVDEFETVYADDESLFTAFTAIPQKVQPVEPVELKPMICKVCGGPMEAPYTLCKFCGQTYGI